MTVAELIARLSELDGNLEVQTDGCCCRGHDITSITSVVTDNPDFPDIALIQAG